jgi:NADPH:quinone reductase-like Zn-dependent oxidoreductase
VLGHIDRTRPIGVRDTAIIPLGYPGALRRVTGGVDLVLESVGRARFPVSLVTRPFIGRVVVYGAASRDACLTMEDLVFAHPSRSRACTSARSRPPSPRCTEPSSTSSSG